mgnify:FL=1
MTTGITCCSAFNNPVTAIRNSGIADCIATFTSINTATDSHHALTGQISLRQACHCHSCRSTRISGIFHLTDTRTQVSQVSVYTIQDSLVGMVQLATVDGIGTGGGYDTGGDVLDLAGFHGSIAARNPLSDADHANNVVHAGHVGIIQTAECVVATRRGGRGVYAFSAGIVAQYNGVNYGTANIITNNKGIFSIYDIVITDNAAVMPGQSIVVTECTCGISADSPIIVTNSICTCPCNSGRITDCT